MMRNKQGMIIILLVVLLVLSVGYILINNYKAKQLQNQLSIYQQGLQAGYEQAVIQLFQQALTCQQVPIWIPVNAGNQTINKTLNLIAVECLQQR